MQMQAGPGFMDDQNKNLILAMVLSSLVLVIWMVLFPPPEPSEVETADPAATTQVDQVPGAATAPEASGSPENVVAETPEAARVPIDTPSLAGSISLAGGRIDQLSLVNYDVSVKPGSDEVTLLSPVGSAHPYYAVFGWVPGGDLAAEDVPATDTIWSVESGGTLTPESPIVLRWDSPTGLIFRRTVEVDDRFMFTVTQSVENTGEAAQRLAPYGLVARHGTPPDLAGFFILHEGAIRRTDGQLEEISYKDIPGLGADERWGGNASVIEAQEKERQRLARQMHDGPAQSLTNLILQAEICERLFDTDPIQARVELGNLKNAANVTFQKVRDFILTLRPMMLDDLGLMPTLKQYVQDFEDKTNLAANFTVVGREARLAAHTEVTLFRMIQELLTNAQTHAHATHVQVALDFDDGQVTASVEDDGSGFDVNEIQAPAQHRKGLGLATIQERAEMLGALECVDYVTLFDEDTHYAGQELIVYPKVPLLMDTSSSMKLIARSHHHSTLKL